MTIRNLLAAAGVILFIAAGATAVAAFLCDLAKLMTGGTP